MGSKKQVILASGSRWRRELLDRLGLEYTAVAPDVDETPEDGETPARLVARLARKKAEEVFRRYPDAVVIGSDQVADLDGTVVGKPRSRTAAIEQLRRQSGRTIRFHTGVCVLCPGRPAQEAVVDVDTVFRNLSDEEIRRYVDAEDVTATAGSIKSEGLGITLVEAIRSDDPTALIGLPLITLRAMLAEAGLSLP